MIELNLKKNGGKISFTFNKEGMNLLLENYGDAEAAGVTLSEKEVNFLLNRLNYYKWRFLPEKKKNPKLHIVEKTKELFDDINRIDAFPALKQNLKNFLTNMT